MAKSFGPTIRSWTATWRSSVRISGGCRRSWPNPPRRTREARSAAQLQHRHIVGTYEVGEVDGRPYIASEYILGTDLAARAKALKDQNRLLPPRDIALLCAQVAEALHPPRRTHEAGIVHET